MTENRKAAGVIPVRYGSRRFPGKPLALITGRPMIQHVYERARQAPGLDSLIIATDDERIYRAASAFGADVLMTSARHRSGTERAAEAALKLKEPIIINIQGDEPLVKAEMIEALIGVMQDESIPISTLACKVRDLSRIKEPGTVKVVFNSDGFALYFSRSPLPHGAEDYFWKHIGIYAYRRDFLLSFAGLKPSRLEKAEKLEQLRALENGFPIKIVETTYESIGVDYPEDIARVEVLLKRESHD